MIPASQKTPKQQGDFAVYENVAFFKEHTLPSGVPINRTALERICQRCNERIRDTGDFPPVVIGHTTDDGGNDPEAVGFAGSFYVGTLGNVNPKAAIFGTMWIFAEDAARVKKYPRVSVEYWTSHEDQTVGYFDPISLLGAETPELDLGIRYAKQGVHLVSDEKRARYAKQAAANVLAARAAGKKMEFADEFNRLLKLNK